MESWIARISSNAPLTLTSALRNFHPGAFLSRRSARALRHVQIDINSDANTNCLYVRKIDRKEKLHSEERIK
jgi:hypothetical protein